MTFSIVARDHQTGQLGIAVASCVLNVGAIVPYGQAGVGVMVAQALPGNSAINYTHRGVDLMRNGLSSADTLKKLLAEDKFSNYRQLGLVDTSGLAVAHSGVDCIESFGHKIGKGFCVQGNLLLNDNVIPAMYDSFASKSANESFSLSLLATLAAGEKAGGDARGRQSAAIIIFNGKIPETPAESVLLDLRVENSNDPIEELKRHIVSHRANVLMLDGDEASLRSDFAEAARLYGLASQLTPHDLQTSYWEAVFLICANKSDLAIDKMKYIFAKNPNWILVTERLIKNRTIASNIILDGLIKESKEKYSA